MIITKYTKYRNKVFFNIRICNFTNFSQLVNIMEQQEKMT